jgi:hypothetical protein
MLATLDKGVTGGKWYSLIDKLYPETTLRAAFKAVAANRGAAGVDHVSIEHYAETPDANLARLSEALRTGTYRPQAIRRHYIPKPGSQEKRPLGIPTIQDRVVQTASRMVLEPIPRVRLRRPVGMLLAGLRPTKLRLSPRPWVQGPLRRVMNCSRQATSMWSMPI